jgi:hypothetical protein
VNIIQDAILMIDECKQSACGEINIVRMYLCYLCKQILFSVTAATENQSTEGAEFVWVSECQKGEGCEIINQFVFV